MLAEDRTWRHATFLDGKDGLARVAIEHEELARFRTLNNDVDSAAVVGDRRQRRRGRYVVVPQVVMHGLKMPNDSTSRRTDRDDGVCVAIVAASLAAEVIGA